MSTDAKAKSLRQKLSNIAVQKKIPYSGIETAFLIERLVARLLTDKTLASNLIFKGGYVGLRVYNSKRYTVDIDAILQGSPVNSSIQSIIECSKISLDDGVIFTFEKEVDLLTQGEYHGKRIIFRGGISNANIQMNKLQKIHLDIGIGDAVVPDPVLQETSELIGEGKISWMVYSVETICAEKIHALVNLGDLNSRSKDIFDLAYFLPMTTAQTLRSSLKSCFEARQTPLPKNLADFLNNLKVDSLKLGWENAVSSVKNPPTFAAARAIVTELLKQKT